MIDHRTQTILSFIAMGSNNRAHVSRRGNVVVFGAHCSGNGDPIVSMAISYQRAKNITPDFDRLIQALQFCHHWGIRVTWHDDSQEIEELRAFVGEDDQFLG